MNFLIEICSHAVLHLIEIILRKKLLTLIFPPLENRPTFKNCTKLTFSETLQTISRFCDICFRVFENDDECETHMSEIHDKKYKCEKCNNEVFFTDEKDQKIHDELFHIEYKSLTLQDMTSPNFFQNSTPYYQKLSTRKRKLHPLCVMAFPEKKRVTFRLGEETTDRGIGIRK